MFLFVSIRLQENIYSPADKARPVEDTAQDGNWRLRGQEVVSFGWWFYGWQFLKRREKQSAAGFGLDNLARNSRISQRNTQAFLDAVELGQPPRMDLRNVTHAPTINEAETALNSILEDTDDMKSGSNASHETEGTQRKVGLMILKKLSQAL